MVDDLVIARHVLVSHPLLLDLCKKSCNGKDAFWYGLAYLEEDVLHRLYRNGKEIAWTLLANLRAVIHNLGEVAKDDLAMKLTSLYLSSATLGSVRISCG